jgi:tetratricopeptide (TPR) repeat protein
LYSARPAIGTPDDPSGPLQTLQQAVAGAIAIHVDQAFGGLQITSEAPQLDAYLEYLAGRELFGRDYPRLIAHFERASEMSPGFLMPRVMLVMAYSNLGDDRRVAAEMSRIADRTDRLTKAERLLVEYLTESLARRPADALRALTQLQELAPASWVVNYGIQQEALVLNRPRVAIEAFHRVPLNGRHVNHAWRLSLFARALHAVGDYQGELDAARLARKYQPGALSYASSEVRALAALGRLDELIRVIEDALAVHARDGNPGTVMEQAAIELRAHGYRDESIRVAARAAEWLGSRPEPAINQLENRALLARVLYLAEAWDDSFAKFTALASEDPGSVDYAGYLGAIAARQGRTTWAAATNGRLEQRRSATLSGRDTYWRACITALLGDKAKAVELLRQSLSEGQYATRAHHDPHFESLRDFEPFIALTRLRD